MAPMMLGATWEMQFDRMFLAHFSTLIGRQEDIGGHVASARCSLLGTQVLPLRISSRTSASSASL
jgi:hypothetical protein